MQNAIGNEDSWEPKVIALVCKWCPSLAADLAGVGKHPYPANVRVVYVPCIGRINPLYVAKALQGRADGVAVFGCHPGDCHYLSGNLLARRRFSVIKSLLQYLGVEPQRVQVFWLSGSEGTRFATLLTKVIHDIKMLGPADRLVKWARLRRRA